MKFVAAEGKIDPMLFECPHCQARLDLTGVRPAPSYRCPTCSGEFSVGVDTSQSTSKPLPPPLPRPQAPTPTGKFCFACGNQLHHLATICPKCGVPQSGIPGSTPMPPPMLTPPMSFGAPTGKREPWLALLFSFLCPGIGQLYNGQTEKGVVLIIVSVMLAAGTMVICIPILLWFPLWIWAMYDAFVVADWLNRSSWRK